MPLLRFTLLLLALAVAVILIAAHGVRALAAIVVVLLAVSVPRSRTWRAVERRLVGLTGSRRRAAALAGLVVLGVMVALAVYGLVG